MSSSSDVTARPSSREPARWPWAVLAAFLAVATVAMVLVVANDEPIVEQIPYVIAFAMFGVVGAFIVSRDRRNTDRDPVPLGVVHHRDVVPVRRSLHVRS